MRYLFFIIIFLSCLSIQNNSIPCLEKITDGIKLLSEKDVDTTGMIEEKSKEEEIFLA